MSITKTGNFEEMLYGSVSKELINLQEKYSRNIDVEKIISKAIESSFIDIGVDDLTVRVNSEKWIEIPGIEKQGNFLGFNSNLFEDVAGILISDKSINNLLVMISKSEDLLDISGYMKRDILKVILSLTMHQIEKSTGDTSFMFIDKELRAGSYMKKEFSITSENISVYFDLILSEQAHFSIESKSTVSLSDIAKLSAGDLICEISCIVGEARLTPNEQDSLYVGDCLLMNWGKFPNDGAMVSLEINDQPILTGNIRDGKNISIEGLGIMANEQKEKTVDGNLDENDIAESIDKSDLEKALKNIDVVVKAEMGSVNKTIEEILNIKMGHVIEIPNDGLITLKVNNRIFARGRIVKVGDRYGVQIIEGREQDNV